MHTDETVRTRNMEHAIDTWPYYATLAALSGQGLIAHTIADWRNARANELLGDDWSRSLIRVKARGSGGA